MNVDLNSTTLPALNTRDLTSVKIEMQSLAHERITDSLSLFVQSKCLSVWSTKTGIAQNSSNEFTQSVFSLRPQRQKLHFGNIALSRLMLTLETFFFGNDDVTALKS